jgi:cation:H+ antiporter
MTVLLLIAGIAIAVVAADLLIDGGVALARRWGIPSLVVGAIVVGFGTSMPELIVNVSAALKGSTDLAMGNILGSNLFNLCVVMAVAALVRPLVVSGDSRAKDLPMCLLATALIGVCGNQLYWDGIKYHELMPSHGIIMLMFFGIYLYYTLGETQAGAEHKKPTQGRHHAKTVVEDGPPVWRAGLFLVLGLAGLLVGGEMIVDNATAIASSFGISERLIGLLIVGPGTSVPELFASVAAALKKQSDMVVGNVLGSCIFNILFTMGITSLILPVPMDQELNQIVLFTLAVIAVISAVVWFGRSHAIGRVLATGLLAVYIAQSVWAVMAG